MADRQVRKSCSKCPKGGHPEPLQGQATVGFEARKWLLPGGDWLDAWSKLPGGDFSAGFTNRLDLWCLAELRCSLTSGKEGDPDDLFGSLSAPQDLRQTVTSGE